MTPSEIPVTVLIDSFNKYREDNGSDETLTYGDCKAIINTLFLRDK
jgi:hypothetical protein